MQTEKKGNRIAVLIPCYNEALTIGNVVRDYRQALPDADIYVYDNNSTDETARLAREAGAIVRPEPRQGKGNVVRTMFRDIEADCYLMVDGDDTYPASQAAALLSFVSGLILDCQRKRARQAFEIQLNVLSLLLRQGRAAMPSGGDRPEQA